MAARRRASSSVSPWTVTSLPSRSTSTRSTPATWPTSCLIAASQWAQWIPGTEYVIVSLTATPFLALNIPHKGISIQVTLRLSASAGARQRGADVVGDVLRGEVDGGVQRGDPLAVPVEDADVGGVDVGVAGVDGGEDPVGLPDRSQLSCGADQVVDLAHRAALAQEAAHVAGCVDGWVDGDRERGHLAAGVRVEEAQAVSEAGEDDRAGLVTGGVDEGGEHDSSAQARHAHGPAAVVVQREVGGGDPGRWAAAPVPSCGRSADVAVWRVARREQEGENNRGGDQRAHGGGYPKPFHRDARALRMPASSCWREIWPG